MHISVYVEFIAVNFYIVLCVHPCVSRLRHHPTNLLSTSGYYILVIQNGNTLSTCFHE